MKIYILEHLPKTVSSLALFIVLNVMAQSNAQPLEVTNYENGGIRIRTLGWRFLPRTREFLLTTAIGHLVDPGHARHSDLLDCR